ncbi:capsid protein [Pseudorasbora circovirus 1]|uniref:Capsid protein n=1 Tax=Pseudorasbora circovirus 1 TaxID=2778990 RepID=A0A8K1DY44_9CIRC|nr:capsid protein [Pseudorasbora circovirus 1]
MAPRRRRRRYVRRRRFSRRRAQARLYGPTFSVRLRKFQTVTVEANTGTGFAYSFALRNFLPNGINWDHYRFNTIVFKLRPRVCNSYPGPHGGRSVCMGLVDLDDVQQPKLFTEIEDLQNVRVWPSERTMSFKWRPRAHLSMQEKTVADVRNAGIAPARQWIKGSYLDIPHFGIKMWLVNNMDSQAAWDMEVIAYVTFRQPLIKQSFGDPMVSSALRASPTQGGVAFGDDPPGLPPLRSASLPC